ncbi:hypothetical protein AV530_016187 [Patagioenas fasciata monilis]|uniref:Uncharacterized protein n=1 Tax=Patagioenas fasciata monilis TaxID=372326 RepID=A0A1V4JWD5_PATFA|nr:hypothetical protein AV530_016187 [Patagioenas fasciata monilis]
MVLTKQQQSCSPSHYVLLMFLLPPGLRSISEAPVGSAKNRCKKNRNSEQSSGIHSWIFFDCFHKDEACITEVTYLDKRNH